MKMAFSRRGFTLVELLVVITIIGILIGLLMPAVQSARESARQAVCKNHLYQMGRAMLQHESHQGYYPSSGWGYKWVGDPNQLFGRSQPGGWIYNLLPYMELNSIHQIGKGESGATLRKSLASQKSAVHPLFLCPSRRAVKGYPLKEHSNNVNPQPSKVAKTDYAACGGSFHPGFHTGPSFSCVTTYPNCSDLVFHGENGKKFDGMSGRGTQVVTVPDGTSRTIFAGEKYLNPNLYNSGTGCADNNSAYQGYDWDVNRHTGAQPRRDTEGVGNCDHNFGSAHSIGFNVLMADGSAHFLSFHVDLPLFKTFGSRNGGSKATIDELLDSAM